MQGSLIPTLDNLCVTCPMMWHWTYWRLVATNGFCGFTLAKTKPVGFQRRDPPFGSVSVRSTLMSQHTMTTWHKGVDASRYVVVTMNFPNSETDVCIKNSDAYFLGTALLLGDSSLYNKRGQKKRTWVPSELEIYSPKTWWCIETPGGGRSS